MPRRYKFNKTHTWTKYTHLHKNIFNVFFFVFLCVARFVLKNVIGLKRNFLIYFSTHYTGLWMRLKNKFGWWLSEFIEKFYILKLSKLLSRQGLLQGSFGWFAFGGGGGYVLSTLCALFRTLRVRGQLRNLTSNASFIICNLDTEIFYGFIYSCNWFIAA